MSIRDIVRRKADRDLPVRAERSPALTFQRDMNRLFDDFFNTFDTAPAWPFGGDLPARAFTPAVNVAESDKEVTVTTEVPGMEEKDVSVELQDDILTIAGEKKTETEEKGKEWHRREYSYGSFRRTVPLPVAVESDKAKAKLAKGVLTIVLPKRPGDARRRKTIAVSGG
jgi:HSP20 family protein